MALSLAVWGLPITPGGDFLLVLRDTPHVLNDPMSLSYTACVLLCLAALVKILTSLLVSLRLFFSSLSLSLCVTFSHAASLTAGLSHSHALTWLLYISHLMFAHAFTPLSVPVSFSHHSPSIPEGGFQSLSSPSSGKGRNKPKEPSSHPWPLVPATLYLTWIFSGYFPIQPVGPE